MKPVWSGSISFGLVSIPIKLYSAIQEHVLGFKLLCKTCDRPVKYQRWCSHCKKEVSWENVVKGLEVQKGEYLILSHELIKKLKPEKSSTINIIEFVPTEQINHIYYDKHYYVGPTNTEKAYTLFHDALKAFNKTAIGQFVMRDKEYVCAIQAYDKGLLLSTLHYSYEIRAMDSIAQLQKAPKIEPVELKLAKQLIDQLSKKSFDISKFKDTFAQELKALIKKREKGKLIAVEAEKKPKKRKKAQASLMQVLKESIAEARA